MIKKRGIENMMEEYNVRRLSTKIKNEPLERSLDIVLEYKAHAVPPNKVIFTMLLKKINNENDLIKIINVFENQLEISLSDLGIEPGDEYLDRAVGMVVNNKRINGQESLKIVKALAKRSIIIDNLAIAATIKKMSNYKEVIEVIEFSDSYDIQLNGIVLRMAIKKDTINQRQAINLIEYFFYKYKELDQISFGIGINKCSNAKDSLDLVNLFVDKYDMKPDHVILNMILNKFKFGNDQAIIKFFDEFCKKYRILPDIITMNTMINKVSTVEMGLQIINRFVNEYDVMGDKITFANILSRSLMEFDEKGERKLSVARSIVNSKLFKQVENDELIDTTIRRSKQLRMNMLVDTYFDIVYSKFLFMIGEIDQALRILNKHINKKDKVYKNMILLMVVNFVPENSPLIKALESVEGTKKMSKIKKRTSNFDDIYNSWEREFRRTATRKIYGGGTVYDGRHSTPVNKQASNILKTLRK